MSWVDSRPSILCCTGGEVEPKAVSRQLATERRAQELLNDRCDLPRRGGQSQWLPNVNGLFQPATRLRAEYAEHSVPQRPVDHGRQHE